MPEGAARLHVVAQQRDKLRGDRDLAGRPAGVGAGPAFGAAFGAAVQTLLLGGSSHLAAYLRRATPACPECPGEQLPLQ
jgi:hypothetical protein